MMHRLMHRACALTLGVSLTVAMAGCGGGDSDTKASELTTLSLGVPPVGDSLPVYDAIEKGYFKDAGLEIKLVPAANGATTINALISQSTDLALVSYPSLISARASGLPVTIAAMGINGTDEYKAGLYVKADSPVKKPADMLGKTMATPSLGSVGDIWFRGILKDQGLDYTKVMYVEIPQANMATALKAGDVDGAFMTEPTLSAASKALELRAIGFQNGPQGLFATSEKTLKEQSNAVKGFREAMAKAVADIAADPHGVAEKMMPKYTKMDAQTAVAMNLPEYVTEWEGDGVQKVIDLMVALGLIDKGFDAKDLYDEL